MWTRFDYDIHSLNNEYSTDLTHSPTKHAEPIRPPRCRFLAWWLLTSIGAVAFLMVGTLASYHAELRNDQYQLIHLGQTLYHGGRLYVDCWENKPPGIAWITLLGLWMTKGDPVGAWLPLAPMALAAVALFGMAVRRTLGDTTACLSVLMVAAIYSLRLYDSPSINPDFCSSILELAALSLWCHAMAPLDHAHKGIRRSQLLKCLLAGLIWLAATMCKQVGCVGLLAITLTLAVLAMWNADARRWLSSTLVVWLGFALGLLTVGTVLAYQGITGEAWRAIVSFNTTLASPGALLSRIENDLPRISSEFAPLALPIWLALIGLVLSLRRKPANDFTRTMAVGALTWLILAGMFALLGPSRAMRYWLALFPPLLLLASAGVAKLVELFRLSERGHRTTLACVFMTVAFLLTRPLYDAMKHGVAASVVSWQKDSRERDRLQAVGAEIRNRTSSDDRIYVWGYHAGVYVYSDRLSASRFVYPRSAQQTDEILTALESGHAKLLLLPKGGAIRFDPSCDEICANRIKRVMDGCQATEDVGDYRVWACN